MFDGIKFILHGFTGRYAEHPEGRKLIWAHLVVTLFTLCALVFIAYVSYNRYLDLVSTLLPRGEAVALIFTVAIALFMLTASSYVAVFGIQAWVRPRQDRELSWQGALIFLIAGIAVGILDYHMNLDGAAHLAKQSAGTVAVVDEPTILQRYQRQILPLQQEKDSILRKYTWKGVTYFKPTRYRPQAEYDQDKARFDQLSKQISELRQARQEALNQAHQRYQRQLQQRDQSEALTYRRLATAVRYIYYLQFLLCVVAAYISHVLSQDQQPGPLIRLPRNLGLPALPRRQNRSAPLPQAQAGPTPIGYPKNPSVDEMLRELLPDPDPNGQKPGQTVPPHNPGVNPGLTPQQQAQLDQSNLSERDRHFLQKYPGVVADTLEGASIGHCIKTHQVSRSTIKNIRRCMKTAGLIE